MQQDLKTYEVQIAGMPLRLKATHDQETVNEILDMVEEKFKSNKSQLSKQDSAILTCLRLAEELYTIKNSFKTEINQIESLVQDHVFQLENATTN